MLTVIDHANPWLSPSSTFAATIQLHEGAVMIRKGTGAAASQPAINIERRENRSERRPANRLATAFASPNAAMNDTAAAESGPLFSEELARAAAKIDQSDLTRSRHSEREMKLRTRLVGFDTLTAPAILPFTNTGSVL